MAISPSSTLQMRFYCLRSPYFKCSSVGIHISVRLCREWPLMSWDNKHNHSPFHSDVVQIFTMSGCRVFIGRLSPHARERDVEKFFKGYGRIREINLKNGFGFVVSTTPVCLSNTHTHTHLCLCSGKVLYKWIIILVITCLRCVWGWNAELTGVCVCLGVWWPQRCGRRGVRVKRKGAVQWEVRWTWCYGLRFGLKVVRTWDSCDAAVGR